jgi:hypothetical protein
VGLAARLARAAALIRPRKELGVATSTSTLGDAVAEALTDKDFERVASLLHPHVDFRALTPNQSWQASDPQHVVDDILREWLGDATEVKELIAVQTDAFASCQRVGFRFRGHDPDVPFIVEQQAYLEELDGQISWMRLLCSGMRTPS